MPLSQRASLVAGVFLALHLLLAFWSPLSLWGIDFLAFYETFYLPIFVVLSLALLIPGTRRFLLMAFSATASRYDSM